MAFLEINLEMSPGIAKPIFRSLSHRYWFATRSPMSTSPSPLPSALTVASKLPQVAARSEQILKDLVKEIQDVHADLLSAVQEIDLPPWLWAKPGDSGGHHTNAPPDVREMAVDKHLAQTDARITVPDWLADNGVLLQGLELTVRKDVSSNEAAWKTADGEMSLQRRHSLLHTLLPSPVSPRRFHELLARKEQRQKQDPLCEVMLESSSAALDGKDIDFLRSRRGPIDLTCISSSLQEVSSPTRDKEVLNLLAFNENLHESEPVSPAGVCLAPNNTIHRSKIETTEPCIRLQKSQTQSPTPQFLPLRMRIVSRHESMQKSQVPERRRSMPSLRPNKAERQRRREPPQLDEDAKPTSTRKEELRQRVLVSLSQARNQHRNHRPLEHRPSEPITTATSIEQAEQVAVYSTPTYNYIGAATSPGAVAGFAVLQQLGSAADSNGDALWRKLRKWYAMQPTEDMVERLANVADSLDEEASLWSVPSGAPASEDLYLGKYEGGTAELVGGQEDESEGALKAMSPAQALRHLSVERVRGVRGEAPEVFMAPRPLRLGEKVKAQVSIRQRVSRGLRSTQNLFAGEYWRATKLRETS
ncbi:uncharacterized protein K452DRAFT_18945 [Aplosporella prunicola CBS 121167]|uniref:Uncharacterized protein n=1 Tax=Aplosporella prunicola CBS 121167 TaxID=1176127 RepID=A0A6A6BE57_9PEZI|nr:uncharacterized protein K452DRAFT_18945 [Aplosporella prunicola CBS 121167]KAF2142452.1 hypothetical protein K452DRAFT_18945 [Aplosporella prunicola CBS 121167]